jgi:hypothetical protein
LSQKYFDINYSSTICWNERGKVLLRICKIKMRLWPEMQKNIARKFKKPSTGGKNLKCFQCTTNELTSFLLLSREKLDDLDSYVQDHAAQLQDFIKECEQQVENSLKLFHLTRRMEFQMVKNKDNFRNKKQSYIILQWFSCISRRKIGGVSSSGNYREISNCNTKR